MSYDMHQFAALQVASSGQQKRAFPQETIYRLQTKFDKT